MVRHSSASLSVITFSTQNILELYFGRWKVIFWLIIGALFIVTVAFHYKFHFSRYEAGCKWLLGSHFVFFCNFE